VPASSGSGSARVVLRDASGRETVTDLPFYVSSKLLAEGLFDFSIEAGMPRLFYATAADTYARQFAASASGRRGIYDWLTLEAHAEAGAGLWNAGAGVNVRTGSFGVASAALAASRYSGNFGLQSYLAYETSAFGISVQITSQRTFGSYDDLASVTARLQAASIADPQTVLSGYSYANPYGAAGALPSSFWFSARAPKALDRISVGLPLPFDLSTLSASFIHLNDASGRISNILSASWSRGFAYQATAFATAFADIGDRKNCGFLVGLSIPLGDSIVGSAGASRDRNGLNRTVDIVKPLGQQPGSYGWRLHDSEGALPDRSASAAYRSDYARAELGVRQDGKRVRATAELEGAVVTMGNGVFLANRIDDGFAVVDTGVAGVEVFHENRSVGFTDASGRALIPSMRSYQKNKISIDTRNLPVDADISTTQEVVAPADRAGVRLDFAVHTNTRAAVLKLTTADGQPVPAGTQGKIEGGEEFVVGYDGRAWVKGLSADNTATVRLTGRECRASFAYSARQNALVVIPVTCR
jgi:outer membrane usher protein